MPIKQNTFILLVAVVGLAIALGSFLVNRDRGVGQPTESVVPAAASGARPVPDSGQDRQQDDTSQTREAEPVAHSPLQPLILDAPVFRLIQPEAPDPAQMALIMGKDPSADRLTRVKAVAALGNDLAPDQINALYRLMAKYDGQDPFGIESLNLLKNEAAEALLRQDMMPEGFVNNLSAMLLDDRYNRIWRDYCVQFLGRSFSRQNDDDKALVARVLWYAADNIEGPIAGTTLIALQSNTDDPLIDRQRVFDLSHAWVAAADMHPDIRTTALQISAEMGDKRILPIASALAVNTSLTVRFRVSAIAAIGQLGNSAQRDLLEQCTQHGNATIRLAAKAALKRLKT